MQARNLIFVCSILMSVALIHGEVKDGVQSEVVSEVEGKSEKLEQSDVPAVDDVPPELSNGPAEESDAAEESGAPVVGILGSCSNPGSYQGQELCYPAGQYCGECVSFVKVCTKDYRTTSNWVRGKKVRNESISEGTAIATFPNGKYSGHAAIYISQNGDGIQVWDQWVGHPVSKRTIRWNGSGIANNGDSFYVIN